MRGQPEGRGAALNTSHLLDFGWISLFSGFPKYALLSQNVYRHVKTVYKDLKGLCTCLPCGIIGNTSFGLFVVQNSDIIRNMCLLFSGVQVL